MAEEWIPKPENAAKKEELETRVRELMTEWPEGIPMRVDGVTVAMKFNSLCKLLVNKGLVDQDEINIAYLEERILVMEDLFEQAKLARVRSLLHLPNGRMDIPKGN